MDSTTTLVTFMLQTSTSVRSVELIGSWDNFTKHYTMEKDSRRARGQWRGCYAFDNIIYDGDGSSSPVRNGGLKMGHTYWYYYKVDGDIETYDTSMPSTTSCPILPGQPVNTISIPVEDVPLRDRSASVGSKPEPLKTLNPHAKYETPRRPPPTPKLTRLNTSTGHESFLRRRQNSPETPKSSRLPWSPRAIFGPKSPVPTTPSSNSFPEQGLNSMEGDSNISYPILISRTDDGRKCVSLQDMRQQQQDCQRKQTPRQRTSLPELDMSALDIEDDEDDNFAVNSAPKLGRDSQLPPTILSPPPSRLGSLKTSNSNEHVPTLRLLTANGDAPSKPLPRIPTPDQDSFSFASKSSFRPAPLRLTPPENQYRINRTDLHMSSNNSTWNAKSHFSIDSLDEMVLGLSDEGDHTESLTSTPTNSEYDGLSSGMISPADSQYSSGCASPTSLQGYDDEDSTIPSDFSLADSMSEFQTKVSSPTQSEFQYNPMISEVSSRGFQGYSLPDEAEYGSEYTLKREVTLVESSEAAHIRSARATFGGPLSADVHDSEASGGSLQGLLTELGYLGEAITN